MEIFDVLNDIKTVYIDAGVSSIKVFLYDHNDRLLTSKVFASNANLHQIVRQNGLYTLDKTVQIYITGKLQNTIHKILQRGELILSSASLWCAATKLVKHSHTSYSSLGILEISASGYMAIAVERDGSLKDGMLNVNPRCGAGSGVNLDRVLQKLAINHQDVDLLLGKYLGKDNQKIRETIHVRADRCGVFASSATISDKNQGIPLDFALAVTLKSEVLKACKKFTSSIDIIWLSGGIFAWQFARDCASDYFYDLGVKEIHYDKKSRLAIEGMRFLRKEIGDNNFVQSQSQILKKDELVKYPSMHTLREDLKSKHLYHRLDDIIPTTISIKEVDHKGIFLGLDVGSTMAKLIIAYSDSGKLIYKGSYSNAGDTIDTIKQIFIDLQTKGIQTLYINQIGITGSARYQVQKALINIYPKLADRVSVLVENYAHAQGSLEYVYEHIQRLKQNGIKDINESFCLLVDIGGEDTKISSISLQKGELYDNAMNVKCSAGTGSLMDTLSSMFYMDDIKQACEVALNADNGYMINATCAVFLMENARKLQADGYPVDEILASANWAIVENMARTLWSQIDLPPNTIALLHGQTMLSDPLPVAVAHRLQTYTETDTYCLVPPEPGHRACVGLISLLKQNTYTSDILISLDLFINKEYTKKIIQCKGVACGDAQAQCNRCHLSSHTDDGKKFSFSLGGCTAINEFQSVKNSKKRGKDTYKQIWEYINKQMPSSKHPNRLIIPRSFAVSEWAMFFAKLFTPLDIPVEIDNVQDNDILEAQPYFHIDTCAPHIGVVGQFLRLAKQDHGMILAPQIKFLPLKDKSKKSLGRTCTINQGGMAVAQQVAKSVYPKSNIHLFYLDLKNQNPYFIAKKIYPRLRYVFDYYQKDVSFEQFVKIVENALKAQKQLYTQAADYAVELMQNAIQDGKEVALILGREYILNPGIYDSHIGRLLRDKGMAGIPAYLLDVELNPEFSHLYWRNPHMITTIADAVVKKQLHTIIGHNGLKGLFQDLENSDKLIPIVQVSTFSCGPDSVSNQLISEITKHRPYLMIQSDAIIKELAHLENRMNTYVKQLESDLHKKMTENKDHIFDIKVLDKFTLDEHINKQTDVIYFPTLSDNRTLTSLIRAAGYSCIDLYSETYDLQSSIKQGRTVAGDMVCAPLAAVYGDILLAIEDFKKRKDLDPTFKDKTRLLIFNNKGLGPCRQGQYVETHKIFLNRDSDRVEDFITQFLVAHENKGFNIGLPKWVFVRGIQSVILQGVLHQILAYGASECKDYDTYIKFMQAYKKLTEDIYNILEYEIKPSSLALKISNLTAKVPVLSFVVNYFAFGLYKNEFKKPLEDFVQKWCSNPLSDESIKIHIDGEAYMRIAQYEDIHKALLANLGFEQFILTHTPLWSFLDYKLAGMLMRAKDAIKESRYELKHTSSWQDRIKLIKYKYKKTFRYMGLKVIHYILRDVLAKPLYSSANLKVPESMVHILDKASSVIETKRPGGELVPYVGEALLKLEEGYDLVLNVAPEGCMVSSMGEAITPGIYTSAKKAKGKIQHLFSQQGDVDSQLLQLALLKTIGPYRYYCKHNKSR